MLKKGNFPKDLRISAMPVQTLPHYALQTDTNGTFYTNDCQVISLLREMLGFKVQVSAPPDGQYGRANTDGNWTGLIGMVQRGEADFAMSKLSISQERMTVVDFSFPYLISPITFITDKPKFLPNKYAIVEPFSPDLWIALAICLIVLLILCYIYKYKNEGPEHVLLTVFGILLEETLKLKFRNYSTGLLLTFWIFGAMFLTSSYKAVLLSFLTFPTATGIRDIAQLADAAQDRSFKCSTYPGSYVYASLLNATEAPLKKVAKCLTQSDMFTIDFEKFLTPRAYRKAYIGTVSDLNPFRKAFFVSDDSFFLVFIGIAVSKKFCCKNEVDVAIHRMAAAGFLQRIYKQDQFFNELDKMHLDPGDSDPNRKLSLGDVSGAFVLLLGGYVVATLVFVVELLLARKERKEKVFVFDTKPTRERSNHRF